MAYYAAPLIAKGKVLGVIEVLHREPFDRSRPVAGDLRDAGRSGGHRGGQRPALR